ncbi:MAG: nucleotidyltransferase substrate binding protein [Acinetobacter sp.]|nr:nucleotidyltransferase substrate binding protein [Acinetobacter sp.]
MNERIVLRVANYQKAVNNLQLAITQFGDTDLDIIKEGIIQRFEISHELAWKIMADILKYEGHSDILGSRSATRLAFNVGLIDDGDLWLNMIESRNMTVHVYNPEILNSEFRKIIDDYLPLLLAFHRKLNTLLDTSSER